jgi:hypothetical protein
VEPLVEELTTELSARYVQYVETLLIDLNTEENAAEFKVGFSLRSDHELRQVTIKATSDLDDEELGQEAMVRAVFEEIETFIDQAVATEKHKTN